jgi:hypothetical protein
LEPPSRREKQRHYNRTAKIAKDSKKHQLLKCAAMRGLDVASGTATMSSSKNGDLPRFLFTIVPEFIGVYRRSSRSNDLRRRLKIDSPRHAWKTDIGTGFIGG